MVPSPQVGLFKIAVRMDGACNAHIARQFKWQCGTGFQSVLTGWKAGSTQVVAMIDHTDMGDQPAGTPEVLHYLHDVLGSVVALTNSNGAVVERYDYDPYGATYILDPAGVPRQLLPVDPWAADGYFHDHDQDGDLDAADYADLVACANDTPYDPMCIYTHDRTGDRRVDHVDVGAYLAHADSNGLVGPPAGMANFGRPLRLPFDADGDGRIDLFDWYALQTCYDRATTRCTYLFDADASAAVDGPDLDAFRASADAAYSGPPSKPWRRQLIASRYGNPLMWTGQRRDATTGQYHFWARTYSPRLGRWMQRDPLEYIDGPSQYAYGSPSPVVATDAFGLWPHDVMSEMIIRRTRTEAEVAQYEQSQRNGASNGRLAPGVANDTRKVAMRLEPIPKPQMHYELLESDIKKPRENWDS